MSGASNTQACVREVFGLRVVGALFDAPIGAGATAKEAAGDKTLIFEDGTGLTFHNNGAYWRNNRADIARAIEREMQRLADVKASIENMLDLSGASS